MIMIQNDQRCDAKYKLSSLSGLEPPTFRLTAERANRLRNRDLQTVHEWSLNVRFHARKNMTPGVGKVESLLTNSKLKNVKGTR